MISFASLEITSFTDFNHNARFVVVWVMPRGEIGNTQVAWLGVIVRGAISDDTVLGRWLERRCWFAAAE